MSTSQIFIPLVYGVLCALCISQIGRGQKRWINAGYATLALFLAGRVIYMIYEAL